MSKIATIIEYVNKGGGAVQFHTINNICLAVENGELCEVQLVKPTPTNIYGIKHVPYNDSKILERVYKEILLYP